MDFNRQEIDVLEKHQLRQARRIGEHVSTHAASVVRDDSRYNDSAGISIPAQPGFNMVRGLHPAVSREESEEEGG